MTTTKPFDISTAKVAVLMGGRSAEREISLMSGEGVLKALQSKGVNAHAFDPANQAMDQLTQQAFTHAFIALHGRYGEDGSVQGALELLGIPYTGSGVMASAIAMDKVMTKRIWSALGLPTPKSVSLAPDEQSQQAIAAIPQTLGLPLIVKPPREGSSIGITKVTTAEGIEAATQLAIQYDPDLLCEEFIDGEELTCPVVGNGTCVTCGAHCRPRWCLRLSEQILHRRCEVPLPQWVARKRRTRDPSIGRRCLPCTGLPRLGPCRHHVARNRSQALSIRDEYITWYDEPFFGTYVSKSCRY